MKITKKPDDNCPTIIGLFLGHKYITIKEWETIWSENHRYGTMYKYKSYCSRCGKVFDEINEEYILKSKLDEIIESAVKHNKKKPTKRK